MESQNGHVGSSIDLPRDGRQGRKVPANKSNRFGVLDGLTIESKPRRPGNVEILGTRKCDEHSHSRVINTGSCKQEIIIDLRESDTRQEVDRQGNKVPSQQENIW